MPRREIRRLHVRLRALPAPAQPRDAVRRVPRHESRLSGRLAAMTCAAITAFYYAPVAVHAVATVKLFYGIALRIARGLWIFIP